MTKPQPMSCHWCKSRETHRPLTEKEKVWLRGRIGEQYVENYFMCTKGDCRKLRTDRQERRFRTPVEVPTDLG
ncbi:MULTISPECIES: hypothetical protein [unclassified Streptomyces]|uniref:hypothetical protein n=1 Tax=unclassified Streptomyces TaxID=2593676 RepID=UPI002DDBB9FB|nr:hypothetical protein [Streptomyces sp. NBC_01445]WSE07189.1 hypothetical protein OG574_29965 [Streptomyces sp. NBC_01445]